MPNINDERWLIEATSQIVNAHFDLLAEQLQNTALTMETFRNEFLNLKELDPAGFATLIEDDPATES